MKHLKDGIFFSDLFNSVTQRQISESLDWDFDLLRESYLGRLRLELLVRDRIILTDAQALDGMFFLDLVRSDSYDRRLLGRKLILKSRAATTAESRLAFLVNPDETWRSFRFSCIRDRNASDYLVAELNRLIKEGGKCSFRSLEQALEELGAPHDELSRLVPAWEAWDSFTARPAFNPLIRDTCANRTRSWRKLPRDSTFPITPCKRSGV